MSDESRFDYKKAWADIHTDRTLALADSARQANIEHFKAILEYSKIAINGAFLLNGMAGIAIVYNMDKLGNVGFKTLIYCALGAAFAILCSGISYIGQRLYAHTESKNSANHVSYYFDAVLEIMNKGITSLQPPKQDKPIYGHILSLFACLVWVASVAFFLMAVYFAFPKFQEFPQQKTNHNINITIQNDSGTTDFECRQKMKSSGDK